MEVIIHNDPRLAHVSPRERMRATLMAELSEVVREIHLADMSLAPVTQKRRKRVDEIKREIAGMESNHPGDFDCFRCGESVDCDAETTRSSVLNVQGFVESEGRTAIFHEWTGTTYPLALGLCGECTEHLRQTIAERTR